MLYDHIEHIRVGPWILVAPFLRIEVRAESTSPQNSHFGGFVFRVSNDFYGAAIGITPKPVGTIRYTLYVTSETGGGGAVGTIRYTLPPKPVSDLLEFFQ